jgi:predicted GNAT superfamily acetyltransferase
MTEPPVAHKRDGIAHVLTTGADLSAFVEASAADAEASAQASGVCIREIDDHRGCEEICNLFADIWRSAAGPPITSELLTAMAKTENYVAGAFLDSELVGAAAGFFAAPAESRLHSYIAGVSPRSQAHSVGYALKLHQRAWALLHGITVITWTFDPLVRRNAYFNLGKLAAVPMEYLPNFYGPMHDQINGQDQTDRLLVQWNLTDAKVLAACSGQTRIVDAEAELKAGALVSLDASLEGEPRRGTSTGEALLVAVPADIERLRRDEPAKAARWRAALREALGDPMATGARVKGFDRTGWYVLVKEVM